MEKSLNLCLAKKFDLYGNIFAVLSLLRLRESSTSLPGDQLVTSICSSWNNHARSSGEMVDSCVRKSASCLTTVLIP